MIPKPLEPSNASQISIVHRKKGNFERLPGHSSCYQPPDLLRFFDNELFSRGSVELGNNVKHLLFALTCAFIKVLH